jgi:hypothetical protein
MDTPRSSSSNVSIVSNEAESPLRRVAYRWFVEYNPLYLVSATLVLAGCFLLSSGVAPHGDFAPSIEVALIAEAYALSLLGGAALLTRIGQRRPAVMLALLFVVYQWDLTLHTETCAYLSSGGKWAAGGWFAIFVAPWCALPSRRDSFEWRAHGMGADRAPARDESDMAFVRRAHCRPYPRSLE